MLFFFKECSVFCHLSLASTGLLWRFVGGLGKNLFSWKSIFIEHPVGSSFQNCYFTDVWRIHINPWVSQLLPGYLSCQGTYIFARTEFYRWLRPYERTFFYEAFWSLICGNVQIIPLRILTLAAWPSQSWRRPWRRRRSRTEPSSTSSASCSSQYSTFR